MSYKRRVDAIRGAQGDRDTANDSVMSGGRDTDSYSAGRETEDSTKKQRRNSSLRPTLSDEDRRGDLEGRSKVKADKQLPPLRPARPPKELSQKAVELCQAQLGMKAYSELMESIEKDDELETIASRRGLLVKFIVTGLSQLCGGKDTCEITCPEYADVNFLRRRIMKTALEEEGKLVFWNSFTLRCSVNGNSQELRGDEYLFSKGFCAGEEYRLHTSSAWRNLEEMDRSRQNLLLSHEIGPVSDNEIIRNYQEALQGVGKINPISAGQKSNSTGLGEGSEGRASAFHKVESYNPSDIDQFQSPRNQRAGKWSAEEIEVLINGIQTYGKSAWTTMHKHLSGNGIQPVRTPVDYKDKWRNLLKAAQNPNPSSRATSLSPEMREIILNIAQSSPKEENAHYSPLARHGSFEEIAANLDPQALIEQLQFPSPLNHHLIQLLQQRLLHHNTVEPVGRQANSGMDFLDYATSLVPNPDNRPIFFSNGFNRPQLNVSNTLELQNNTMSNPRF